MTTNNNLILKTTFYSFINEKEINKMATELGVFQRIRKIEPAKFVLAQIFAVTTGSLRTLENIRLFYCQMNDIQIARSSFYEYYSPGLASMMKQLVDDFCENNCQSIFPLTPGEKFTDIVIQDSSVVTLDDKLEYKYPSCRFFGSKKTERKKSALKVHIGLNPLAPAPQTVKLTSQPSYDGDQLQIDESIKDILLMFDRGLCKYRAFHKIIKQGGYFVTRYQSNFNPSIIEDVDDIDQSTKKIGTVKTRRVKDVIREETSKTSPPETIDYRILATDRYEKGGKRKKGVDFEMRLIGVWDNDEKEYHCYFTNLPADCANAERIAALYSCRWDIEMQFKELKSYFKLDQIETGKDYIVECLIYAALLSWLMCRLFYFNLLKNRKCNHWDYPHLRFAVVFLSMMPWLLHAIKNHSVKTWKFLEDYCIKEMKDPWINRKRTMKQAFP